ncbi:MAG: MFS transporter [Bacillota bacterium]|jgi:MFS family permease
MKEEKNQDSLSIHLPIRQENLWTKNFLCIFFMNIALFMSFHMLTPTFTLFIKYLGGSDQSAGIAAALISCAAVMSRPFVGWFLDNKGRKWILIVGIVILLSMTLAYNIFYVIITAITIRFIQGIGWSICTTGMTANAADTISKPRFAEGMSYFGMTTAVSLGISPALGLWLIKNYDFHALFYVAAIFAAVALLLAFMFKYKKLEPAKTPAVKKRIQLINKNAIMPSLLMLLCLIPYGAVLAFIAVYAEFRDIATPGVFFVFLSIATVLSRMFSGKIADQKGENIIVMAGLICFVAAILGLSFCHGLVLYIISAVIFGFAFGFAMSSLQSLAMRNVPFESRGAASSTFLLAFDIGIGLGGLIAGWIADQWGYEMMFPIMMIPVIIAIILYFTLVRKIALKLYLSRNQH